MDWLKEILEKAGVEKVDEVLKSIKTELPKHFITKEKFNEVNEAKKQLENDIKTRDKQLKELADKVKGNEELEQKIKDLQEANKKAAADYEAKIKNITLDNAIKIALKDNKAKYEDLLMSKFNREKLKIKEDGTVEGLEEQLKTIKETYKDLFEQPISGITPNNKGTSSGNTSDLDQITKTIQENLGL
ncbi:phage scaffolding protein [Caminicella sporogenes]|uniref:phage scaffolding protein n=1 Tax=Caminicella sporogenes TaxID=166485 RepID=UPI00253F8083|nr:phage scaffolding protein [Caminicella sporogenes]WIF95028.1 phage scaffolding protein [Caminicella sporogenes]